MWGGVRSSFSRLGWRVFGVVVCLVAGLPPRLVEEARRAVSKPRGLICGVALGGFETLTSFAPQPAGCGEVFAPQPAGCGAVFAPQPAGRGEVFAPQPAGRGAVFAPQPAGRGAVFAPQPAGCGEVFAPQPAGCGEVFAPQPAGSETGRGVGCARHVCWVPTGPTKSPEGRHRCRFCGASGSIPTVSRWPWRTSR